MKPIQLVLLLLLILFLIMYFYRLRTRNMDRLIVFFTILVCAGLVTVPELSNKIAFYFGVGRGVDLIIYLWMAAIMFILLLFYTRLREIKHHITLLVREITIERLNRGEVIKQGSKEDNEE